VVSGVVADELHISVRNVGYVRSAGEVTRAAFGDIGSAGGHRTMAKAMLPLRALIEEPLPEEPAVDGREVPRTSRIPSAEEAPPAARACQERIVRRFLRALGPAGRTPERTTP
jgi:hypothetical protein